MPRNPRPKRSRTRSGCITCRDRHMKCDEQMPVCQNCINSRRRCYRGVRLNFTQYTIYDPREGRPTWTQDYYDGFQTFKLHLIDQLVAVALMYVGGRKKYQPYLPSYTREQLAEALRHFHEIPQEVPQSPNIPGLLFPEFGDLFHEITENTHIRDVLLNPVLAGGSGVDQTRILPLFLTMVGFHTDTADLGLGPPPGPPPALGAFHPLHTSPLPFALTPPDPPGVIALLLHQRYSWLLDMFDGLDIWRLLVPMLCVKLVQNRLPDGFLLACLMASTDFTPLAHLVDLARAQSTRWPGSDVRDLLPAAFRQFEHTAISVVLLLNALLLQVVKSSFVASALVEIVLAGQGKMIRKICRRYLLFPESTRRTPVVVAVFHALAVLRLLLRMHLAKYMDIGPIVDSELRPDDIFVDDIISYDHGGSCAEFFAMAPFESSLLASEYATMEHPIAMSDPKRARMQLWATLRQEHNIGLLNGTIHAPIDSAVLIPSDSVVVLNLLALYSARFRFEPGAEEAASRVFALIEASFMDNELKRKWVSYFGWVLAEI